MRVLMLDTSIYRVIVARYYMDSFEGLPLTISPTFFRNYGSRDLCFWGYGVLMIGEL